MRAPGQANTLSDVTLGDGAHLAHVKCTLAGEAASHLATWLATLGQGGDLPRLPADRGDGRWCATTLFATFKGEGAKLDISGVVPRARQPSTSTPRWWSITPCPAARAASCSRACWPTSAHGVFQGKVIVRPDAQKSDGKQMAQVLMLSQDAEFDSKPELEIHADDVVCGHGSTAAEIDEDLLFYMRARGIPVAEARALLIESFIVEAIEKVEDERLRAALAGIATRRLAALSASQA